MLPKAKDASLKLFGTALKDSSVVDIIQGRFIRPIVNPEDRIEGPKLKKWTNNATPNNPYTIDGTPAKLLDAPLKISVNIESLAYSDK